MAKPLKALIVIGVLAALAYIVTSSMELGKVSCEVCMEFRGRRACRPARGATRAEALTTARDNACAQLATGRTENILCSGSEPASVTCSD